MVNDKCHLILISPEKDAAIQIEESRISLLKGISEQTIGTTIVL